jgi:hypothetical protein
MRAGSDGPAMFDTIVLITASAFAIVASNASDCALRN